VADVDVAVGVRRAVMQDEFRATFADLPQLPVQVNAVPALQNLRLRPAFIGNAVDGRLRVAL